MEEFDGLGDRSNALLTWYFVSVLLCIAWRYTVLSVLFREIVRCFGPSWTSSTSHGLVV